MLVSTYVGNYIAPNFGLGLLLKRFTLKPVFLASKWMKGLKGSEVWCHWLCGRKLRLSTERSWFYIQSQSKHSIKIAHLWRKDRAIILKELSQNFNSRPSRKHGQFYSASSHKEEETLLFTEESKKAITLLAIFHRTALPLLQRQESCPKVSAFFLGNYHSAFYWSISYFSVLLCLYIVWYRGVAYFLHWLFRASGLSKDRLVPKHREKGKAYYGYDRLM